jgi:hypothetical protein
VIKHAFVAASLALAAIAFIAGMARLDRAHGDCWHSRPQGVVICK